MSEKGQGIGNGRARGLIPIRQGTAAVVRLARAVRTGDSVAIVVHYGGRLVGFTATGSLYIRDHVARDFTILREDALAFPILDLPSWAANRSIRRSRQASSRPPMRFAIAGSSISCTTSCRIWNPRDLDQPSARWNEGLASFLQWRMAADLDGWDAWDARLGRLATSLRTNCEPRRPCATVPFADYGTAGLIDLSYSVGAVMFSTRFRALGPDTFDCTYRAFLQQHRERGATSGDLVTAFRAAHPLSAPILTDWYSTTRWSVRLTQDSSLQRIVDGYVRP